MLQLYQEEGPKIQATVFLSVIPPALGNCICKVKNMTKMKVKAVWDFWRKVCANQKKENEHAAAQHFFSVATKNYSPFQTV